MPKSKDMWSIMKGFNSKEYTSSQIKEKIGLTKQEFANFYQASDTGAFSNFDEWFREVTKGTLVNHNVGAKMNRKKVFNATLRLIAWRKKIISF